MADDPTFTVVWTATGASVTDAELAEIALHEPWAKGLFYCDMEGFAVDPDGTLILLDECGRYREPPTGLFKVIWR